jgi:hypothetical protein
MLSLIRIKKEYFKRNFSIVKNLTVILFVAGILILLNSCIKDETLTLQVSALSNGVNYGETATIFYSSANATTVAMDGVKLSDVNGTFVTPPLLETVTFTFAATGSEGTVSKTITIVVKQLDIEAYALPAVVNYSENSTIHWKAGNDVSEIRINGFNENHRDSVRFTNLALDTSLTITFVPFKGDKIVKKVEIKVIRTAKQDSLINIICLGPFQPVKRETEVSPGVWEDTGLAENYKSSIWTFYKNGRYTFYDTAIKADERIIFNGDWNFVNETTLYSGGGKSDIISLDKEKLVLGNNFEVWSTELNKVVPGLRYRTTYSRAK